MEAGSDAGEDDPRVALEALGAAIHHGDEGGQVEVAFTVVL